MKAIIPVAGIGGRLKPHTYSQPKALIPVAGKPILSYIMDHLVGVGIRDFVFIVGYLGEEIRDFVAARYPEARAEFVIQVNRSGLGHAVWTAREYIEKEEEIFIALGDTIFEADLARVLRSPHSSLGVRKVDDPRLFGVAEVDKNGLIMKVVEKPNIPKSNLAIVGLYRIRGPRELIAALDHMIQNRMLNRNEYQLTDAIQSMIDKGIKFTSFPVDNWYDCGKKEILLSTNAALLRKFSIAADSQAPLYKNTIIIHPVSVDEGCVIRDSIIGPDVSIGKGVTVERSIISDSIIGSYAEILSAVLRHSVVGGEAHIKGLTQSLNIGDSTEIDFS